MFVTIYQHGNIPIQQISIEKELSSVCLDKRYTGDLSPSVAGYGEYTLQINQEYQRPNV